VKRGTTKVNATIFTSLDIGTTKIVCVISSQDSFGALNIQGVGELPWEGLHKGVVTNVSKTAEIIRKTVDLAQRMAGVAVTDIWVNISGEHLRSVTSSGMMVIQHKNNEIGEQDKLQSIDAARAMALQGNDKIIAAIPLEFVIDGQQGIEQPVGMHGVRLESRVLICTAPAPSIQSIEKSIKQAGYSVAGIVLDSLASGCAILSSSEKNMGVAVVDIGGQATNVAIYLSGTIHHVGVVGAGSSDITRDIAQTQQLPQKAAEELKKRSVAGDAPNKKLAAIIAHGIKEILVSVKAEIQRSGHSENIVSGIVLTGGGVLLNGVCGSAEKLFKMPVRVGMPAGLGGLMEIVTSPSYATAVGLCIHAAEISQRKTRSGGKIGVFRWIEKRREKMIQDIRNFFRRFFLS
jgi:cell division protein FtsA